MKFFNKIFKGKQYENSYTLQDLWNAINGGSFLGSSFTAPNLTTTQSKNYYQGLVASCINFRANTMKRAKPILYLYENQSDVNELDTHKLINLFRHPNTDMPFIKILEFTSKSLDIYGNAYWYLYNNKDGTPYELYFIPADEMSVVTDTNTGEIKGYARNFYNSVTRKQEQILYDINEVWHFKNYNPYDQYYGLSLIQLAAMTLGLDFQLSRYQTTLLKNDAVPKGIALTPRRYSKEDRERLEKEHQDKYGGVENAGKTQFLSEDTVIKPVQLSPKDLDYIDSKRFTTKDIFYMFQVPASALGDGGDTNKATSDTNIITFNHNVIYPILDDIAGLISLKVSKIYKQDLILQFNLPLPQDREQDRLDNELLIQSNAITLNELRKAYKYDKKPEYERTKDMNAPTK